MRENLSRVRKMAEEQVFDLRADIEQHVRGALQGLLTGVVRDAPLKVPDSDPVALFALWQAAEFLHACGWVMGCHHWSDTYYLAITTPQTLALQDAGYLQDPLMRAPGYVSRRLGPRPTAAAHHHPSPRG